MPGGEEDLRKLAANLGLEVSELAPAPENAANTRFKAKLRGGLASFLLSTTAVSDMPKAPAMQKCWVSSKKTILVFRVELLTPCSGKDALPGNRSRLSTCSAKSTTSLSGQNKQSSSVSNLLTDLQAGYRGFPIQEAAAGDLPTVMIDGRKFNCVASIARAHGLDP